jgi:glycogen(starch) synthase
VFTRGPEGFQQDGPVRVIRARSIPPGIAFRDLVPWSMALNLGLLGRSAADVAEGPPDVIHLHDWLVAPAALALRDLTGSPVVATVHATEQGRHGGRVDAPVQRFVDGVERWLVEEVDRIVTCSAHMRGEVGRVFGVEEGLVEMIPNQVDMAAYGRAVPARNGRPTLLFAGRLEYEKGVQTLLEAIPLVARDLPWARLRVVGRGTYAGELRRRTGELGLEGRVRFDGFVDAERLRELYLSSDAVVVPSLYEPFGLVALEAMASGVPVVASDTGGLRELVEDEVTGLRFPPGDHAALARTVVRVLSDPDLARRLGREGRAMVAGRDTWAGAASRTAEVYRLALRDRDRMVLSSPPGRL